MWLGLCFFIFVASTVVFVKPLRSQQKSDIAVESKLVNVLATVRDKHGAIVRNLTKDDFVLLEDGHPQAIQYFSQDSNLPLTLGLLVDTSMSQRTVLGDERTASYTFLDHMLHEDKDKAFLIHFDREVELLQDLTSSREKLESSLRLLDMSREDNSHGSGGPRSRGGGGGGGSRGGMGAGTLLYDAVYLASNELMKKQQGRKAVIILSDGVDRGSKESLADAIESAQRADTLVYSILFSGEEGNSGGGLADLASEWAGPWEAGAGAATEGIRRNRAWTARKSSIKSQKRQARECLKYRRNRPLIRFMRRSKKSFAINTVWVIRPEPIRLAATTKSSLRRSRRILWYRRGTATISIADLYVIENVVEIFCSEAGL